MSDDHGFSNMVNLISILMDELGVEEVEFAKECFDRVNAKHPDTSLAIGMTHDGCLHAKRVTQTEMLEMMKPAGGEN